MFSIFPQRYCFSEKTLPLQGIKTDEMSLKQHIPNTITCGNLVSGCLSILFVASGMPVKAAIMIFVAGLFDFLDGFAARLLHAHSPIGADLDSLSDVVSFGVAPGFIMYWLMSHAQHPEIMLFGLDLSPCIAFLLPVFSSFRLANFNIDDTQKTSFRGIPAPGMAIFIASLPLALSQVGHLSDGALGYWICHGITIIFSLMMVSNFRFFSFKMKSAKWKGNEVRWIFLIIALVSFVIFRFLVLPFVMVVYVLMSICFAERME